MMGNRVRNGFKLLYLSLTLGLFVSLALVSVGCASTAAPLSETGQVSPSRHGSPISATTASKAVNAGNPSARALASSTPTTATVRKSPVGTTNGYRTIQASRPIPSITLGAPPVATGVLDSRETPSAGTEGNSRLGTGYVLTASQPDGVTRNSNTETAERKAGGITADAGSARAPAQSDPVEGRPYSWQDGDRTLTVLLQPDLKVDDGAIAVREEPPDTAIRRSSEGDVGKKGVSSDESEGQPVFRSESGALMTLPGGVLLALDPEWSQGETDVFFANNGIKLNRVSELGFLTNGFFVETKPGFPSLDLANALAGQAGVVLSSPNWWTEVAPE